MTRDRDARGGANNSITVNGKKLSSPIRQETVSIRGIVPGEYTINVNHYLPTAGAPVPVAVKVEKVNPAVEVVHYDTITLDHTGHERTAVRFRIADNGNVVDVNHREKSLIQLTRSVRRTAKCRAAEASMTSTLLAISAAYVVVCLLLLTLGLSSRFAWGVTDSAIAVTAPVFW